MKHLPAIAGALLGLAFIFFGLVYFLDLMPAPDLPAGSPPALFMGAMAPTGYLAFIKACEVLGGLLTAVPRTRNFGLLILGPVVVNILAFHVFITGGHGLAEPPVIGVTLLLGYLLWDARREIAGLAPRR